MDFELTADQTELRHALRDLLRSVCSPATVRESWRSESNTAVVSEVLRHLSAIGVLGVLAPVELDGMGGNEIDLAVLMEECGRFAVPGPLVEHAAVGVPVLVSAGHPEAASAATGTTTVTALEPGRGRVAFADLADLCVVLADAAVACRSDLDVSEDVKVVDWSMRSSVATVRASDPMPGIDVATAVDRATLAVAAQLLGLNDQLIRMTVDYVKVRRQFGVQIGSQQAVKHHLASALIALEHARPVVYRAAYAMAYREPDSARDVSFAKVYAFRAAHAAARCALQCHGAMGYSWEYDLQLWMKRIWALGPAWGTVAEHEARVAELVIGPA